MGWSRSLNCRDVGVKYTFTVRAKLAEYKMYLVPFYHILLHTYLHLCLCCLHLLKDGDGWKPSKINQEELHLLFIVSKHNVVLFQYAPEQALKSWKEHVHLEEHSTSFTISCVLQ